MLKRHLYLPLEILPRELNSKILLSLYAAKSGYRVYLGSKESINYKLCGVHKIQIFLLNLQ